MQSVCAWVGDCVRACMRPLVRHADCSKTIAVTDFFFQIRVLMNFYVLQYFFRFGGLVLQIK